MTTNSKPATKKRLAVAGRCPTCGQRTIRGELADGNLIEVTAANITATTELKSWAAGRRSVKATWKPGIQLDIRTNDQIKLSPAGYSGARIYAEHQCKETS